MIVNHLSRLMGERRLKPADVVRLTGLSKPPIYSLFWDRSEAIQLETLNRLCRALDCSVCDLFEYRPDDE